MKEATENNFIGAGFKRVDDKTLGLYFERRLSPAGQSEVSVLYYTINDQLDLYCDTGTGATIVPLPCETIDELKAFINSVYHV